MKHQVKDPVKNQLGQRVRRGGGRLKLALLLLGLALILVPWPPAWAEALYLGALLPTWSAFSARVIDAVPVSVSLLLLIFLVSVPLVIMLAVGGRAVRGVMRFWSWTALVLLLLFPFTFGLGYRLALPTGLVTTQAASSEAALAAVSAHVLSLLRSSSNWSAQPGAAALSAEAEQAQAVAAASTCVGRFSRELRAEHPAATLPTKVKYLPAGLLLRIGFAGVALPWLLEPHVDAGLPGPSALAVTLHEFAHSAGHASEAEAEAVGMVAGLECSDQRVVYAAALRLATNLATGMPPEARAAFMAEWPTRAVADARAAGRATRRFADAALTPGATAAYDLYLRSQGESGGMAEYDRGTALALAVLYQRHLAEPN